MLCLLLSQATLCTNINISHNSIIHTSTPAITQATVLSKPNYRWPDIHCALKANQINDFIQLIMAPQFGVLNNMCCPTTERRSCAELPGTSCKIWTLQQVPLSMSRDLTSKNYVTVGHDDVPTCPAGFQPSDKHLQARLETQPLQTVWPRDSKQPRPWWCTNSSMTLSTSNPIRAPCNSTSGHRDHENWWSHSLGHTSHTSSGTCSSPLSITPGTPPLPLLLPPPPPKQSTQVLLWGLGEPPPLSNPPLMWTFWSNCWAFYHIKAEPNTEKLSAVQVQPTASAFHFYQTLTRTTTNTHLHC